MTLTRVGPEASAADLERLTTAIAERQAALDARIADLSRIRTGLETFRIRYAQEVGHLHEELDELLDAIAEAEIRIADETRAEAGPAEEVTRSEPKEPAGVPAAEPPPRFTSDAIRKLFREVAKTIHPDLSREASARDQRHALMVEANRAYALGDLEKLQRILQAWEMRPEAVHGTGPEAERERLTRRIGQLDAQLTACDEEIAELEESPLSRLKAMVDEAASNGKDLVADMIRRLRRDILAARNRLDAMR